MNEAGLRYLNDREKAVLKLVAQGWSNKQIAAGLRVSMKTVEYRLRCSRRKLNCENRRVLDWFAHMRWGAA